MTVLRVVFWVSTNLLIACLIWFCYSDLFNKHLNPQLNNTRPLVQIMDITKPVKDTSLVTSQVTYFEDGLIISKYDTNVPMDGYRELHWNRCRTIEGLVLQTQPNTQPQLTVYYREGCR